MRTLTITLSSGKPACPPLSCGNGATVAMELSEAATPKGADGSGWIVGTIAQIPSPVCPIGATDWVYTINFPDTEFSADFLAGLLGELEPTDMNTGDTAVGMCCLHCGNLMMLDKIAVGNVSTGYKRESFRIHGDAEPIEVASTRLFRMHSPLLIHAIEASVEQHISGHPYASDPGDVSVNLLSSQSQQTGPASTLSADAAVIDASSTTPLTARRVFVPALELPSGAGLWANVQCTDPEAYLGLEVHVDFTPQTEE